MTFIHTIMITKEKNGDKSKRVEVSSKHSIIWKKGKMKTKRNAKMSSRGFKETFSEFCLEKRIEIEF